MLDCNQANCDIASKTYTASSCFEAKRTNTRPVETGVVYYHAKCMNRSNLINKAWDLWLTVEKYGIPMPLIAVIPDTLVMFSWDKNEHHLEIEIFPDDKETEFFYTNLSTGELWGENYTSGPLPEELFNKFHFFEDKHEYKS